MTILPRVLAPFPVFSARIKSALLLVSVACVMLVPSLASAKRSYMAAAPMTGKRVRVDGQLREWPRGFVPLDVNVQGRGQGGEALVGYDDNYLYVAAKIQDKNLVRTGAAGSREDHLSLALFVPSTSGSRGSTRRIDVYPGVPGKSRAVVKVDGSKAAGAQAVEAPSKGGVTLEARVPWQALGAAQHMRVGLRGKLTYTDASAPGRIASITSTSKASGAQMPRITLESETALIQALLEPKRLPLTPDKAAYGDLTGQGGAEQVAVYGHYLSIAGPGYKGGKQFYFNELSVGSADRVLQLDTRELTGDGKDEIVLRTRIGPDDSYREVFEVLTVGPNGAPQQLFAHEVSLVTSKGRVENKVEIQGSGSGSKIIVAQGTAQGFEPDSFSEPRIGGGVQPALLPWQTIGSRTFSYQGGQMKMVDETSQQPSVQGSGQAPAPQDAPPPPRPPSADEMLDRVYALYRSDRGVGKAKPSFDFVTDVAENKQMERVLVHGKDLVVFGQGFKEGRSYTFLTIGVREEKDILSITTRDLVGDGKAEILVHAVIPTATSEELGGEVVQRQALFVYKVLGDRVQRIFAAETGRSMGTNKVLGSVAFLPQGGSIVLETRPLRALGWSERTYPFPEDTSAAGGLEPLLLPWGSVGPQRYTFDGQKYTK